MSKHSLSPGAPLPRQKRIHTLSSPQISQSAPQITFDSALYDELILHVFSYLSWADLCAVQATNRNWSRLSADNQLWKALFLEVYGRTRLRGARGFIGRTDGREVKPLPGRVKADDARDWKWMFRISSNWKSGRCTVENFDKVSQPLAKCVPSNTQQPKPTHILLAGALTITASSRPGPCPLIHFLGPTSPIHTLRCPSHDRGVALLSITALALDQSPPSSAHNLRLASFLSTGEIHIFKFNHANPSNASHKLAYLPRSLTQRLSPIITAVYHHPLLITLSEKFRLSIYDVSGDTIRQTQTLTSFTSYPPTSLVLSTPSPSTYKLVLVYAVPVYPVHWSVGATELIISGASSPNPMTVTATRTARAFDVPQGWIDTQKMSAMREQWGRKVECVADTQTDGKWVVLAPGDRDTSPPSGSSSTSGLPSSSPTRTTSSSLHSPTHLQLYRLSLPASSSSPTPRLTFVKTLHGQIGPVCALALADGRCVSLGANGSIWVWDLEGGTGAEVAKAYSGDPDSTGTVVFDERRIISARAGAGVEVRRFDV
ncbi:hypothetical protein PLICRDRAFT_679707 [Plicaturopsis crispa FD-325 SS-3]|nr:hypothetical protein PLICRDRAFT_679707 [Plicaturopsis crispa FD-325 SS-3]